MIGLQRVLSRLWMGCVGMVFSVGSDFEVYNAWWVQFLKSIMLGGFKF